MAFNRLRLLPFYFGEKSSAEVLRYLEYEGDFLLRLRRINKRHPQFGDLKEFQLVATVLSNGRMISVEIHMAMAGNNCIYRAPGELHFTATVSGLCERLMERGVKMSDGRKVKFDRLINRPDTVQVETEEKEEELEVEEVKKPSSTQYHTVRTPPHSSYMA